jgi:DNA modification methylase
MVCTSPPYWGLRDYQVAGQIGLEPTPAQHIAVLLAVFREVRRVLRPDGTLWLNYGDCYAASSNGRSAAETKALGQDDRTFRDKPFSTVVAGLKPKDLVGMAWRVAFALQEDGWWLRRDVIWSKPNPMPESAKDRPATAHEYVFMLTKRGRYFYDHEAVREESVGQEPGDLDGGPQRNRDGSNANAGRNYRRVKVPGGWDTGVGAHGSIHRDGRTEAEYQEAAVRSGRNLRSVWTIPTHPFPDAHFATFPPRLAETCIAAGTSAFGCCPRCGAPWVRHVEKGESDLDHQRACGADAAGEYRGRARKPFDAVGVQNASDVKRRILAGLRKRGETTWLPGCECAGGEAVPALVLDPFGGSGTVGMVADRMGRSAILIELSPQSVAIAERRLRQDAPLLAEVSAA